MYIDLHSGALAKPLLQWKINNYRILLVFIFKLSYPASNALVPYCHLWPVWLYHIFPHYLTNDAMLYVI